MGTLAKIFIAIIFVLSNVFLGFTVAAISARDDNPKYRYMREKRMRQVVRFDCNRLIEEIKREEGHGDTDLYTQAVDSLKRTLDGLEEEQRAIDAETRRSMARFRTGNREETDYNLLGELEAIRTKVGNFAATIKAYRSALESVQVRYANLQDSYQDAVRQFESLAIEKKRMQVEKERILEDHRAIEQAYFEAQRQAAGLTDTLAVMTRQNPDLPDIVRQRGRMVEGMVQSPGGTSEAPNGVVVINVGRNEGVAVGQQFSVFDGESGLFKARIRIMRVEPNTAVGMVEPPYQNVRISGSDTVRRAQIFVPETGSNRNR